MMMRTTLAATALAALTLAGCSASDDSENTGEPSAPASVDTSPASLDEAVGSLVDKHGFDGLAQVYFTESEVWVSGAKSSNDGDYASFATVDMHGEPSSLRGEQVYVDAASLDIEALATTLREGQDCDRFAGTITVVADDAVALTRHCDGAVETVWADGTPASGPMTTKDEFVSVVGSALEALGDDVTALEVTTGEAAQVSITRSPTVLTLRTGAAPTVENKEGVGSGDQPLGPVDLDRLWECSRQEVTDGEPEFFSFSMKISDSSGRQQEDGKRQSVLWLPVDSVSPEDSCRSMPHQGEDS